MAGDRLASTVMGLKDDQKFLFDEGQLRLANGSYVGLAAGRPAPGKNYPGPCPAALRKTIRDPGRPAPRYAPIKVVFVTTD